MPSPAPSNLNKIPGRCTRKHGAGLVNSIPTSVDENRVGIVVRCAACSLNQPGRMSVIVPCVVNDKPDSVTGIT